MPHYLPRRPSLGFLALVVFAFVSWRLKQSAPTTSECLASNQFFLRPTILLCLYCAQLLTALYRQEPGSATEMPSLLTSTVADLSRALSDGRISSAALTASYLARIAEVNSYFCAVIETNPDAISIAQALDEEQRVSGRRGYVCPSSSCLMCTTK
jgi:hypothetical protein